MCRGEVFTDVIMIDLFMACCREFRCTLRWGLITKWGNKTRITKLEGSLHPIKGGILIICNSFLLCDLLYLIWKATLYKDKIEKRVRDLKIFHLSVFLYFFSSIYFSGYSLCNCSIISWAFSGSTLCSIASSFFSNLCSLSLDCGDPTLTLATFFYWQTSYWTFIKSSKQRWMKEQ